MLDQCLFISQVIFKCFWQIEKKHLNQHGISQVCVVKRKCWILAIHMNIHTSTILASLWEWGCLKNLRKDDVAASSNC